MKEMNLYPEVKKALLELTPAVSKIPGSTYNQGLPDYVAVFEGRALHIEVKYDRPGKRSEASELQKEHLTRVHESGGIGCVIHFHAITKRWSLYNCTDAVIYMDCARHELSKMILSYVKQERPFKV